MTSEKKTGPGSRLVNLEPAVLEQFLQETGAKIRKAAQAKGLKGGNYHRIVQGKEIVYVFENMYHPSARMKVYTTIPAGGAKIRAAGKDAMRVVCAYEGDKAIPPRHGAEPKKSFGLFKATRILRTGTVEDFLGRLEERMRDAYGFTNEWLRNHWREVTEDISKPAPPSIPVDRQGRPRVPPGGDRPRESSDPGHGRRDKYGPYYDE